MAINNILGITWIKSPITGQYSPVKNIWIKRNDGWKPVIAGWVKVGPDTWQKIYPAPQGTISINVTSFNFNPVYQNHLFNDSTAGLPFTITNNGNENLVITDITLTDTNYYASTLNIGSVNYPITLAPNAQRTGSLNVYGKLVGSSEGSITIKGTSGVLGSIELSVPVIVNVIPEFGRISLSTNSLTFTGLRGDQIESKTFQITNAGNGGLLNIYPVIEQIDKNFISISYNPNLSPLTKGASMPVTVTPNILATGVYDTTVEVPSDDDTVNTQIVNVRITVNAKTSVISSNPTSVTSTYNSTATEGPIVTITLLNSGTAALDIYSISSRDSKTTISNVPTSINPGSSGTFTIRGKKLASSTTDLIIISNNSANSPTYNIIVNYNITAVFARLSVDPTSLGTTNWSLVGDLPRSSSIRLTNNADGTIGRNIVISAIDFNSGLSNPTSAYGALSVNQTFPITLTPGNSFGFQVQLKQNYSNTITDKLIFTNDSDNGKLELPYTFSYITPPVVTVGPKIVITPSTTSVSLKVNSNRITLPISINNPATSTVSLNVTDIRSDTGLVAFSTTSFTVAPGNTYNTSVILNYGGLGVGSTTDKITFTSNAVEGVNFCSINITVTALNPPVISVTPTSLTNPVMTVGDPAISNSITVTNSSTAEQNLIVSGITSTSTKITTSQAFPFTVTPGTSYKMSLTFDYSAVAASPNGYADNLKIASNDSARNPLTVPVTTVINPRLGTVTATSTTDLVITSISNVMDITVTETTTRRIKNTGNGALNITSIASESGYFSVTPTSSTNLQPGAYITITLTFNKSFYPDVGKYSDNLVVKSDGSNPSFKLPVSISVGHVAGQYSFSFTNNPDITAPYTIKNATYFLVGGGGGGGSATEGGVGGGGGGGAGGGYKTGTIASITKGRVLATTVGAAGAASAATNNSTPSNGGDGGTTTLEIKNGTSVTATYTVAGGGGGKGGRPLSTGGGSGDGGVCPTDSSRNGKAGSTDGRGDKSDAFGGLGGDGVTLSNGGTYGKGGVGGSINDRTSPYYGNGNAGTAGYILITWPAYTPP